MVIGILICTYPVFSASIMLFVLSVIFCYNGGQISCLQSCSESPHGTLLLPAIYCSFLFKNGELISVLNQEKQPLQILKYHFNFLDGFELYEIITKLFSCELIFKKCSMCIKYSSIHVVRNLQYRYT